VVPLDQTTGLGRWRKQVGDGGGFARELRLGVCAQKGSSEGVFIGEVVRCVAQGLHNRSLPEFIHKLKILSWIQRRGKNPNRFNVGARWSPAWLRHAHGATAARRGHGVGAGSAGAGDSAGEKSQTGRYWAARKREEREAGWADSSRKRKMVWSQFEI
jgi:hypothetical protein